MKQSLFYQMFILFLLLSYLTGSIPFGFIVAKLKNVDIRNTGSGNIGATNISRALGMKYAILVGLLDFLKGAIPVFLISQIFTNEILIALVALAAVLGNIFPVFLKFRGGKGISTLCGTLLVLWGIKFFLIMAVLWLTYLYICKIMSLTNLVLSLTLPATFLFIFGSGTYFIYSLIATLLIWYTHRANIDRLLKGEEKKLKF